MIVKKTFYLIIILFTILSIIIVYYLFNNRQDEVGINNTTKSSSVLNYNDFFPYGGDYFHSAKIVPGIEIDLNILTTQQQDIINLVKQRESRLRDINEPITITGMWRIHNEPNHYKIVLTRPFADLKGDILYMATHYYDVLNGEIRGYIIVNDKDEMKGYTPNYLFASEEQYQFIISCINIIKQKEDIDLQRKLKYEQTLIMPDATTIEFTARKESECMCEAIGCCDNFIPEISEYKFMCKLDNFENVTMEKIFEKHL
jgi:hypothetical protein